MELKNFFVQDALGNSIPSPTISVYNPGTTTLATGLKNVAGGDLANPFTGSPQGQVAFRAANGEYDVRAVGAGRDYTMRVRFIDAVDYSDDLEAAKSRANHTGAQATSTVTGLDDALAARPTAAALAATDGAAGVGHVAPYANAQAKTVAQVLGSGPLNLHSFMTLEEIADTRTGAFPSIDVAPKIQRAYNVGQALGRTVFAPDGTYGCGTPLNFGSNRTDNVQSSAPRGFVGESKTGTCLMTMPGFTGTLLTSDNLSGVRFENFHLYTGRSPGAVAWKCRWIGGPGPSTQNTIADIIVSVHDQFTDGVTAHVDWNDLNDTYPRGVTVRPADGVTPSHSNCYISMVQTGGLASMSGCIWTGGFLLYGAQNGEILHSWGHGIMFAETGLNHVKISAGYMYANKAWKTVFKSRSKAANSGIKSLIIDVTEMNTAASPGIESYFDINLNGALYMRGCEFIGTAPKFWHSTARGDGESPAFCKLEGGTYYDAMTVADCPNGAGVEVEAEAFRNAQTGRMLTKNRGGTFVPFMGGSTGDGTATYSIQKGTYTRINNRVFCEVDIAWTLHTATGQLQLKGLPFPNAGSVGVSVAFGLDGRGGLIGENGGQVVTIFNYDGAPYGIAPSGRIACSFSYQITA